MEEISQKRRFGRLHPDERTERHAYSDGKGDLIPRNRRIWPPPGDTLRRGVPHRHGPHHEHQRVNEAVTTVPYHKDARRQLKDAARAYRWARRRSAR